MPRRSKKPCSQPGCPELIEAGNTYCEEHRKQESRRRNKRYDDKQRDEKLRKFYSSARWQKVRRKKIKQDPLCEHCAEEGITKPAELVDHIVPIKVDWLLRLRLDNLQSLCHSCHAKKSEEDKQEYDCL